MSGIPVVISTNGYGLPVTPVEENGAPAILVEENGLPIVISESGTPMIIEGYVP